jgi:glutamine amidotransferase
LIDYGVGNRRSMEKSLLRAGARVDVSSDPARLAAADGLVLPGVGAFKSGMALLKQRGLVDVVCAQAAHGVPLLGACLGMQLLFDGSDEFGGCTGLGLIAGQVQELDTQGLNLPHIGWNTVRWERPTPLSAGLEEGRPFYHVHSFAPKPTDPETVLGTSDYGSRFASVVGRGSVLGTQFHPEKSSRDGIRLLTNFVALCRKEEAVAA